MKTFTLRAFFIAALAAVAVSVACGGNDDESDAGAAAGGGAGTMPVTQALLDSLPDYDGATLVREWLADGGRVQVREYAVDADPNQAADDVTRHFRDALVKDGWQESDAHAIASSFTRDGRRIVIGRVGPELQEAPDDATLLNSADPPANSGFFYTLAAEES
jgi:ABC-type glycerol-3-phosphate transport system substrate-binding protein